jgi:hypothetical protein
VPAALHRAGRHLLGGVGAAHRPVTARVVSIAMPDSAHHVGDTVAFDATPLNEGPAEGQEEEHSWLYPVVELAVPPEVELGEVEAGLRRCTEGLPHPLLWPTLLEKLGRQQEAEAQRTVEEEWEISL